MWVLRSRLYTEKERVLGLCYQRRNILIAFLDVGASGVSVHREREVDVHCKPVERVGKFHHRTLESLRLLLLQGNHVEVNSLFPLRPSQDSFGSEPKQEMAQRCRSDHVASNDGGVQNEDHSSH